MIPALRALREAFPEAELHALVSQEAAPILEHLPWLNRLWALPRTRGKWRLKDSLPLLKALRAERFDRSVDFVGNDRGAILSRYIGARQRLGVIAPMGFIGRKWCYTQVIEELDTTRHEVVRDLYVLSAWSIPFPDNPVIEIHPDPVMVEEGRKLLPDHPVICHLSTSQRKKEWDLSHWLTIANYAKQAGIPLCFSSGPSPREQALLSALREKDSTLRILPPSPDLRHFLGVLSQARVFVSPDTAPLHLAAGLGVTSIGLFGPTASTRWAPLGARHMALQGGLCPCSGHLETCGRPRRCMDFIHPNQVWSAILEKLK